MPPHDENNDASSCRMPPASSGIGRSPFYSNHDLSQCRASDETTVAIGLNWRIVFGMAVSLVLGKRTREAIVEDFLAPLNQAAKSIELMLHTMQ